MSIPTIIAHTPIWVWILFIFLLYRGIKALQPREMTWQRMLFLPIIFFVWALYGIGTELSNSSLAFATFAGSLVAGAAIGWLLAIRQPPARLDPGSGLIHRPGTPLTLILVSVGFLFKYSFSVALVHQPSLATSQGYCALYGAVSGAVDGIFWGGTLLQLFQTFGRNGNQPA